MIFIFCAIYPEAKAVISHFDLKKCAGSRHFDMFASADGDILLTVTGVGAVACATAVSHTLTAYLRPEDNSTAHVLNIGTAAGRSIGAACLIHSIRDDAGRTFYPDMLYECSLKEAALFSHMHTCTRQEVAASPDADLLHDMEGAGFYQAASCYVAPHRISLIKVVSDCGVEPGARGQISGGAITERIRCKMDEIAAYMATIAADDHPTPHAICAEEQELLDRLCADIHCSETMRSELEQYARYYVLKEEGNRLSDLIRPLYEEGLAPCVDKNMGKRCLLRCKELVL